MGIQAPKYGVSVLNTGFLSCQAQHLPVFKTKLENLSCMNICLFALILFFLERGSHYIAQAGLELHM
jgi:hypothetical protein